MSERTIKPLSEIWKERVQQTPKQTWSGDTPTPCFDYQNISDSKPYKTEFNPDNWIDLTIEDFRETLNQIIENAQQQAYQPTITQTIHDVVITYMYNIEHDTHTFIFHQEDVLHLDIVATIYKSRGGIQSMQCINGKSVDISMFTDLLIDLNLIKG